MKKRVFSLLVSILSIALILSGAVSNEPLTVLATGQVEVNEKIIDNLKKADEAEPALTILEEYNKISDLLSEKNKDILLSYGIEVKNVESTNIVKDNVRNSTYIKMALDNNVSIGFDLNGNIIHIANFKDVYLSDDGSELKNIINCEDDLLYLIVDIVNNSGMSKDYKLIKSEAFDEYYWLLEWEKQLSSDLSNPYDALKVVISRKDKAVVSYVRFNNVPNTLEAIISEDNALEIAEEFISKNNEYDITGIKLTIFRPNYYWCDGGPYEVSEYVRLAYEISLDNGNLLMYIDAVTGENIGGDQLLTDEGRAFSLSSLYMASQSATLARNGMDDLGYDMYSSVVAGSTLGDSILNYIDNFSDAYAIYINCHGSSTLLSDNSNWWITTSDISGNWHFVFLNACSTGATTGWANAFNVYGYSNRGFIGWYDTITSGNAYSFAQYFWPEMGDMTLRNAALYAAEQVPGDGTTPVRYYGDTSYYGWAW